MKVKMKRMAAMFLAVLLSFSGALSVPQNASGATADYTIEVGETRTLYANVMGRNVVSGSGYWSSGGSSVRIVSQSAYSHSCTVQGVSAGSSAYVEYRYSYKMSSGLTATGMDGYMVKVVAPSPTSVSLSPSSLSLKIGNGAQLTPSVQPSGAETNYYYSSSNPSVASVSSSGYVTANDAGTATITVRTGNSKTASCYVTVSESALTLSNASPADNATEISVSEALKLTYNQNIAEGSGFSGITLTDNTEGKSVAFTTGISGRTLTITPGTNLKAGHSHTLALPEGAVKRAGGSVTSPAARISFTTKALELLETSPADGDEGVAVNAPITLKYGATVREGSKWQEISLKEAENGQAAAFTASVSGDTLTVTPDADLNYYTRYELMLPAGAVANGEGIDIGVPMTLSFTTKPGELGISESAPENGAENVAVNIAPSVTFEYPVTEGDTFAEIVLRSVTMDYDTEGDASVSGSTLTYTPQGKLNYEEDYELVIPAGALKNESGEPNAEIRLAFSTMSQEDEPVEAPEIEIKDGMVTITAEKGASVYYTMDGSNPETNGILYNGTFFAKDMEGVIRALAVRNGSVSPEKRAEYKLKFQMCQRVRCGMTSCSDVQAVADGYIQVGYLENDGFGEGDWAGVSGKGGTDAVIVKYDKEGNVEWKRNFGGSGDDSFNSVTAAEDGYVAAGESYSYSFGNGDWADVSGKGKDDAIIVKYDKEGNVEWKRNFGGSSYDHFRSVTAAENGYVAAGESFGNGSYTDAIIVKYDKEGNMEWKRNFGGNGGDYFYSVTAVADGYVAAGCSYSRSFGNGDWTGVSGKGEDDAIIVKYDKEGNVEWKRNFGGNGGDSFYSVSAAEDGYVAAGYSYSGSFGNGDWTGVSGKGDSGAVIVKYDKEGNVEWKRNFGGNGGDYFYSVTVAEDGYVAAGHSTSDSFGRGDWAGVSGKGGQDAIIVKYDKEGNVEWKHNFGGSDDDSFRSVTVTEGGYAAAGYSGSGSFGNGDWSHVTGSGKQEGILVMYQDKAKDFAPPADIAPTLGTVSVSSKDTLVKGEEFIANLYFMPTVDVSAVNVELSVPPCLTYENLSSAYKSVYATQSKNGTSKRLNISCDFTSDNPTLAQDTACVLATLRFTVNPDCENGNYSLSPNLDQCFVMDTEYHQVKFTDTDGQEFSIVPTKAREIFILGNQTVSAPARYKASFFPATTEDKSITWDVSDGEVASIDENGTLTPHKNGEVMVTASNEASGLSAELNVTVAGIRTYIENLSADGGEFAENYAKTDLKRVLYAQEGASSVRLTASFDQGSLVSDLYGVIFNGVEKEISLDELPKVIKFTKREADHDDTVYTLTICARPVPEPAPQIQIRFADEKLAGFEENADYAIDGKRAVLENGSLAIKENMFGTTLSIVRKGNGTTTTDSEAQTLTIPSRPQNPTGVMGIAETAAGKSDGKITGVSADMEYKPSGSGAWSPCAGSEIANLAAGNYQVRLKATNTAFAGNAAEVTVSAGANQEGSGDGGTGEGSDLEKEPMPQIQIRYADEELAGFEEDANYAIDGKAVRLENGSLAIEENMFGKTLSIVRKGDGTMTADSEAQTVTIPARPQKPAGITAVAETADGENDGKIMGVNTEMEYRRSSENVWIPCAGDEITKLAAGNYQVRLKATDSAFAGNAVQITVGSETDPVQEMQPQIQIHYMDEKLVGFEEGVDYAVDGKTVIIENESLAIAESMLGKTLSIVRKGNGTTTSDSDAQTVEIPARPQKPAGVKGIAETAAGKGDGKITGVSVGMEYKRSGTDVWSPCAGSEITELAAGTYQARLKATDTAFAGNAAEVTINAGAGNGSNQGGLAGGGSDQKETKAEKLSISALSTKIAAGKKVALQLAATPKNATIGKVTWESDNKKYASVNSKGVVTTKKAGAGKTVKITATAADGSGMKASIKIKVMKHAVTKVQIKKAPKTLKPGKSVKLKAVVKTNGKKANKTLNWSSSNPEYATVDSKGKVTAKKAGKTVTITAMSTDGTKKKAKVKIKL